MVQFIVRQLLNPQSHTPGQSSSSSSSSSSVQLPVAPALSSFADRQLHCIALDRINASLFFHATQPENPLLNRLFSIQDIELLSRLFHEYKIGDNVTWLDLLGLRCFDLLRQLEKIFRCESGFTGQWCPVYFLGYVSLFHIAGGASIKEEKFFIKPRTFATMLNEHSIAFDKCFKGLGLRLSNREKLREKAETLAQDWKKTSNLLGKFLMLPNPTELLCDQTVSGCVGASEMIPTSKEERKKALDQFILYMKLHEEAFEFGVKNGMLSFSVSFSGLIQKIYDIRNHWGASSQEALIARGDDYFKELSLWKEMLHQGDWKNEEILKEAISGRLNHSMWREQQGFQPGTKGSLPQPQFIDRTNQSLMLGRLLIMLSCDYQGIVENCILQSSDHNSVARANRLKHVASSILELSFEGEPDLLEIRDRFKEKLKAAFSLHLIQAFLAINEINHTNLVVFEYPLVIEACLKMQEEIDAFLARLDSEKMEPLSLSQTELNFWAQAFILLHDLKILTRRGPSRLESDIFPNQFLELFESKEEEQYLSSEEEKPILQNLEELPSIEQLNLSSSSIPPSEPTELKPIASDEPLINAAPLPLPSPSMISQSVEKVKQAQKISKHSRKKEKEEAKELLVERKSRKVERMLQEIETASEIPEKLREILEERKRLKVERILREMGMEPRPTKHRGKGGHRVWRDPQNQWGQTVIPEHDELKEGTRHGVVAQLMNRRNS